MKCNNCTAGELTGRAYDASELCEGPVDGEFVRNGELLLTFKALCGAVATHNIVGENYNPHQLRIRPAEETLAVVIDLSDQSVPFSQSA